MKQDSRKVLESFHKECKISQGTYGVVFKAKDLKTKEWRALKMVKLNDHKRDGYPITALREMSVMQALQHPNLLAVREVVC